MNDFRNHVRPLLFASMLVGVALVVGLPRGAVYAQGGASGQSAMLQQKLAAIKTSTAENQRKLHQYTWTQTSQITYKGDPKPPKEFACSYGPDGKVRKIPIGGSMETSQGGRRGRFRQRMVEKKTGELKDYMQQVEHVLALYLPPNAEKMQQAFEAHNVSFSPGAGAVDMVFKNYAVPGDSMTISFQTATKKIQTLSVQSYMDSPQDGITLKVEFASLPDGTNYPAQTTLIAQAKKIQVVNTNHDYRKTYP